MFDETSFSIDAFDQDSWLFLLDAPYFDLTGKQRLYVRTVLESVYTTTETDQIITTAALNAISVLDAAVSLRVDTEPLQIVVVAAKQRKPTKLVALKTAQPPKTQDRVNKPAYAVEQVLSVFAHSDSASAFVSFSRRENIYASADTNPLFINSKQTDR